MKISFAQAGEDLAIEHLLKKSGKKRSGFYIDVGCAGPLRYSNTMRLYRAGGHGLCIDPNPSLGWQYRIARPRDKFICAAIGEKGESTYYQFRDKEYNTLDGDKVALLSQEKNIKPFKKTLVPIFPLSHFEQGIPAIDVLNIDVDGLDMQVLATHDWTNKPTVVAIEDIDYVLARSEKPVAQEFLAEKGYRLAAVCGYTTLYSL